MIPITGVAYSRPDYQVGLSLPIVGGPKPEPPEEKPSAEWTFILQTSITSVVRGVPYIVLDNAKLRIDLGYSYFPYGYQDTWDPARLRKYTDKIDINNAADPSIQALHMMIYQLKSRLYYQRLYKHKFLFLYAERHQDEYMLYIQNYADELHINKLKERRRITDPVFSILAFFNIQTGNIHVYMRGYKQVEFIQRWSEEYYNIESTWLVKEILDLLPFEIKDKGYAFVYAPYSEFRTDGDYESNYPPNFVLHKIQNDQYRGAGEFFQYLAEKKYPLVVDIFPVEYSYHFWEGDGYKSFYEDYWGSYISPFTHFRNDQDINRNYTFYEADITESVGWVKKLQFLAPDLGRFYLVNSTLEFSQAQATIKENVSGSSVFVKIEQTVERKPYVKLNARVDSVARTGITQKIERKQQVPIIHTINAIAKTNIRETIVPTVQITERIDRKPSVKFVEYILPPFTRIYTYFHMDIRSIARTGIEQTIERKPYVYIKTTISNTVQTGITQKIERKPYTTLIQSFQKPSRATVMERIFSIPRTRIIEKVQHPVSTTIKQRLWKYERPIRNLDYYRYYGITIRG